MNLPALVDVFVSTKMTEGRSPHTIKWYRHILTTFITWLEGKHRLAEFTLTTARAFIAHLQARSTRYEGHPMSKVKEGGLSAQTVHAFVRTLKVFSAWLAEEGFTPVDVLAKLKRPKLPETVIETLTDAEIGRILDTCNPKTFLGARMQTIILTLLDTGVRADELLTLKVDGVDLSGNRFKVTGKGNKERYVSFGTTTKKTLMRYLSLWRPETECLQVFTSTDGQALTHTALAHMLTRLGQKVGVPRLHAHLFRHTFAVRFLMNGGDLVTLKLLLGHRDISTTQLYLKLTQSNVSAQYSANSPVDRLSKR